VTVVRTVLGDIPPSSLGMTLAHEHLVTHPPAFLGDPNLTLAENDAAGELLAFQAAGGGAVVEMTTIDYGRDGEALSRLSRRTGVHIVAATGFNKALFAAPIASRFSTESIAAWMIREVEEGLIPPGSTDLDAPPASPRLRAGLIKASSSRDGPTPDERRVFEAAAEAHRVTRAPISTHTEQGTWALEQARLLMELGIRPDRILLGHLDLKPDVGYILDVLATGVFIGIDQIAKSKYLPDEARLDLAMALIERGYLRRIFLSGDIARRSGWAVGGGDGLSYIPGPIRSRLAERGLSADDLTILFVGNAADLFGIPGASA
jgi:predicted metal-dependent phosphotriesterase family hydrolase